MNESFRAESQEVALTAEIAKTNFDVSVTELEQAAMAVGKFETGREGEVDFGLQDILEEKKQAASAAFEAYMKAVMSEGETAGIAARQGNLPLE
jgi:hypothetical protein